MGVRWYRCPSAGHLRGGWAAARSLIFRRGCSARVRRRRGRSTPHPTARAFAVMDRSHFRASYLRGRREAVCILGELEVSLPRPGVAAVALKGEHDLSTAPELRSLLQALVADLPMVLVDVTEAEFIDSDGHPDLGARRSPGASSRPPLRSGGRNETDRQRRVADQRRDRLPGVRDSVQERTVGARGNAFLPFRGRCSSCHNLLCRRSCSLRLEVLIGSNAWPLVLSLPNRGSPSRRSPSRAWRLARQSRSVRRDAKRGGAGHP